MPRRLFFLVPKQASQLHIKYAKNTTLATKKAPLLICYTKHAKMAKLYEMLLYSWGIIIKRSCILFTVLALLCGNVAAMVKSDTHIKQDLKHIKLEKNMRRLVGNANDRAQKVITHKQTLYEAAQRVTVTMPSQCLVPSNHLKNTIENLKRARTGFVAVKTISKKIIRVSFALNKAIVPARNAAGSLACNWQDPELIADSDYCKKLLKPPITSL